jgi:glycine/D-amino acid oxidase-like deaminating enzyme
MSSSRRTIIIGGGFYGCCLAVFFRDAGDDVVLLEAAPALLTRASYSNQARVHGGYHYPRSILTGKSCVLSFPLFAETFPIATNRDFTKLYGIARVNSRVTAAQFAGFCNRVGAPIRPAPASVRALLSKDLIEEVFEAAEYAFDAVQLRELLRQKMFASGVDVRLNSAVSSVAPVPAEKGIRVNLASGGQVEGDQVFNCAFANINSVLTNSGFPQLDFRHEWAEICLVKPPKPLAKLGITVMDGPFFSTMPFPAEKLHSFTHVRYTPHSAWNAADPLSSKAMAADSAPRQSRFTQMLKDTVRYLPAMEQCEYVHSLFEVKTTLGASERNDGRPILFKRDHGLVGLHVVMGGKIDNIFDILRGLSDLRPTSAHGNLTIDAEFFRRLFYVDRSRV